MLRAIIISADAELAAGLEEALNKTGRVTVTRTSNHYISGIELERFLMAQAPQIIFLDVQDLFPAIETVRGVQTSMNGVKVAAVAREARPDVLLDLMRVGVREYLIFPFGLDPVTGCLNRLDELLQQEPARYRTCDAVYSFLPSKAGAGTSTIAFNTAAAMAAIAGSRVLLADLDLNCGMLGFMMKMDAGYSIYEAASHLKTLDQDNWTELVSHKDFLDLLPAGRLDPGARIEPVQIRELISFARRFYKAICLDLSGNMERYSIEAMMESKTIFLVCTPEIPSIHMAQKKLALLREMDLGDRVSVLLNRSQRSQPFSAAQISNLLGSPILMEFPNSYRAVHNALSEGKPIDSATEAGQQFSAFASRLIQPGQVAEGSKRKKKFLEYFNVRRYNPSAPI